MWGQAFWLAAGLLPGAKLALPPVAYSSELSACNRGVPPAQKPIGFFGLDVRNMQQGSAKFFDGGPFGPALQILEARELFRELCGNEFLH